MELDGVQTRASMGANGVELRLMSKGKCRKTVLLEVRQAIDFFAHYAGTLAQILLRERRLATSAATAAPLDRREAKQQIIEVLVALHHCCDQYGLSLGDLQTEGMQAYMAHCSEGPAVAETETDGTPPP